MIKSEITYLINNKFRSDKLQTMTLMLSSEL